MKSGTCFAKIATSVLALLASPYRVIADLSDFFGGKLGVRSFGLL
jgi:hypothetical protein